MLNDLDQIAVERRPRLSSFSSGTARRKWVFAFAALTLMHLLAGWWFCQVNAKSIRQNNYEEIAAIGKLKSGQIQQWRQERLKDASLTAGGPFVRRAVAEFLREPGGQGRADLLECLKMERTTNGYADAFLAAPDGKLLLDANEAPGRTDPATQRAIAAAFAGQEAALSDFFRRAGGAIQIDVAAAVRDAAGRPLAAVILRSDAAAYLYPLIQSWPTPSYSAETLIVQREGDSLIFLNNTRHRANTALALRKSLSQTNIPSVQAVLGRQGVFEGIDYRGVPVLSALRPIPGSTWFMVAKIDENEIFAEARFQTGMIALVVVSLILLTAVTSASIYRQQTAEKIHRINAELEQRVHNRTAQLEAANKELEAFSYSVSHDLRAPLRAIDGYSRILVEDCNDQLDDDGRRVLGVIRAEAQRMGQLIDELLDFSRVGRQKMEPRETDMRALAEAAFKEAASLEPERDIQVQIGALPPAFGEPLMLRQVWANLISNAVKFTRHSDEPRIEIGATGENGATVYFVRDNGAGFDMAHAGKLFGVFQRLHGEEEFEGTGVGLAFVKRIIQRHAGRVWAEGAINQGATFYFTLPARAK